MTCNEDVTIDLTQRQKDYLQSTTVKSANNDRRKETSSQTSSQSNRVSLTNEPEDIPQSHHGPWDTLTSKLSSWYDADALILSTRVSLSMTIASLFVVAFPAPSQTQAATIPHAIWMIRTVTVVTWFPTLDMASSLQRAYQRTIGTIVGAVIGLLGGFLSLTIVHYYDDNLNNTSSNDPEIFHQRAIEQGVFLGILLFLGTFLASYGANRTKNRKNYSFIIGTITYVLALASFYVGGYSSLASMESPPWSPAVWRCWNILVGGILGSLVLLLVWPRTTSSMIRNRVQRQLQSVGKSARLVLSLAHDSFTGTRLPLAFDEITKLRFTEQGKDQAYDSYIQSLQSWKDCQALFPLFDFDPYHSKFRSQDEQQVFTRDMAVRLTRSFRLQTNIVMLYTIVQTVVRDDEMFKDVSLDILTDVGTRIEVLLDGSVDTTKQSEECRILLETDLTRVREMIAKMTQMLQDKEKNSQRRFLWIPSFREDMPTVSGTNSSVL